MWDSVDGDDRILLNTGADPVNTTTFEPWKFGRINRVVVSRGGTLPSNRLMRLCRWMGSHFHDWIDYNGVSFSSE